jgi:hypothetical protein
MPLLAAHPSPPPANPPAVSQAAAPYGFAGAYLGMTLVDWRAAEGASSASSCTAPGNDPHLLVCHGKSAPIGGDFLARDPTFTFADGRLVNISFKTSINGFDFATAALKRRFGEPKSIKRDSTKLADGMVLPHVLMTWTNARSTIKLSDPAPDMTVSVQFQSDTFADAQSRRPTAG